MLAPWVVIVQVSLGMPLMATDFRVGPAMPWALVVAVLSGGRADGLHRQGGRRDEYETHQVSNRAGRTVVSWCAWDPPRSG